MGGNVADRLSEYEQKTSPVLLGLAIGFLVLYGLPILQPDLPAVIRQVLNAASLVIWIAFGIDFACRVVLAEHRLRYVVTHPVDLLTVALPALRPLRVLRVFTAGQALISRGRLSLMKTTQAVLLSAGLLIVIGTLAVLDAERNAAGSNINAPSTALWWAVGNVTSVSYNSAYPVTATGKIVAIALTIVGLSLIGVITAAVAAWFIAQTKVAAEQSQGGVEIRLAELEAKINAIHDTVCTDSTSENYK